MFGLISCQFRPTLDADSTEGSTMQINSSFDKNTDGFTYSDNLFSDAYSGRYANGWHSSNAGDGNDGALVVQLGGQNGRWIRDMSGGWTKKFETLERTDVDLTFKYKLIASPHFESDEYGEVRVALDGEAFGRGGNDYVARIRGDGNGGGWQSTGWQEVTIPLGELEAGTHKLDLGGFLNKKNASNELVQIIIEDVRVNLEPLWVSGQEDETGGETGTETGDDTGAGTDGGTGSGSGGGTGTGSGLAAFEAEVIRLTNQFRAQNGVDPLEADARLSEAAEDWSRQMAEGDMFRHSDTSALVEAEGYDWRALGENIAAGYRTPADVVQGWIDSPGHRRNMLSDNFEEIGVGHVYLENDGGNLRYGHYWTQIFGTEADWA